MSFRSGRKHNLSFLVVAVAGRRISGGVNLGGIHKHDWDIVLNRVDAAALAAFEAVCGCAEHDRLLADRANQYVEQILRDHGPYIVARGRVVVRSVGVFTRFFTTESRSHGENLEDREKTTLHSSWFSLCLHDSVVTKAAQETTGWFLTNESDGTVGRRCVDAMR